MAVMTLWQDGKDELGAARARELPLLMAVGLFSFTVNLLMLTGPLFMMQVYDRVLTSRSVPTLVALFALITFLFVLMGIVDLARNRVMIRVAMRFHDRMQARIFDAVLSDGAGSPANAPARGGLRDLDAIARLIAAPLMLALFDLPFAPLFMAAVFIMHPLLGGVALAGLTVLALTTFLNQAASRSPLRRSLTNSQQAERMADLYRDAGEVIDALGMRGAAFARWRTAQHGASLAAVLSSDRTAGFNVFSRTFRQFLQSGLLAAGAWLVLKQQITPGAMIAASILMARALAPVEQVVGNWPAMQHALLGWGRLAVLLTRCPQPVSRTTLPRPEARLDVRQLAVIPPDQTMATLRAVSFSLIPGQAMGVIGPSGAGKTTLAKALIGAWAPAAGSIRLGGATLDQYDRDRLGRMIGYLPQQVTLFDGTIAENIARLSHAPDPGQVVAAAQAANAHQMILSLPQGYDTVVSQTGDRLSGGQIQRIGLARALYGEPLLLVLDEPNSNLDSDGSEALSQTIRAIKARGGIVVITAHRPAAITECDLLLVLEGGIRRAFGRRDIVLKATLHNTPDTGRTDQARADIA